MIYPLVTVVCLLLRGQLSLQRNHLHLSDESTDALNSLIKSCTAKELSKLLSQTRESAPHRKTGTEQMVSPDALTGAERIDSMSGRQNEVVSPLPPKDIDNSIPNDYIAIPHIAPKQVESHEHDHDQLAIRLPKMPENELNPSLKESIRWPVHPSLYPYPLMIGHRKPLPDATIRIGFKNKEREVNITVSPLMTIYEALKQAELKFQRTYKLPLDASLISFWRSPTLHCVIIDRISTIRSDRSMIWTVRVIDGNGELQYDDYCLPSEFFVTPGSTLVLNYKSVPISEELN